MKKCILILMMIFCSFSPIKAEYLEVYEPGETSVSVVYEKAASFSVLIPKKLQIDEISKKTEYEIQIKGDLGGTQILRVEPNESFKMNDTIGNKDEVEAQVVQAKTGWTYREISNDYQIFKGTVSAEAMSAGSWTGTLIFTIDLQ